jgi:myo-inositol-1(or 4)-monophosphatase
MRDSLNQLMREVASHEVMPRYLNVAHQQKNDGSLFTEADLAAQAAFQRHLPKLVDCPILGEEMSPEEQLSIWRNHDSLFWCVDPIDGTSNFVHGIPFFALSVALIRSGRPVLGAVYDPVSDELFSAELGQGATLNDSSLPLSAGPQQLQDAIASVDLKRLPEALARQLAHHPPYASQRNFGASTLEWCWLAAGRVQLTLHGGQKLWDYAAGSLILSEAGGRYCCLDQDDFWAGDPWQRSVVATIRPELLEPWKTWLRQH